MDPDLMDVVLLWTCVFLILQYRVLMAIHEAPLLRRHWGLRLLMETPDKQDFLKGDSLEQDFREYQEGFTEDLQEGFL